ncbi:alpha/beta hydrolase [bacterium]|nr:alpha/beta hydrolase [bacterium]
MFVQKTEEAREMVVEINGIKIFIRIKGQGKPFLILHGWGASADSWREVQNILSKNFQVIVLDLPGFGRSDLPPQVWNLDNYKDFILRFLEKMKLEKVYLLGHSFGGNIAIKLSVDYPEKFTKIVLVDAAAIRRPKNIFQKIIGVFAGIISLFSFLPGYKFLRRSFYRIVLRKTDYLKVAGTMKEVFKKVISEDLKDYCHKVKVPTLIIWGKKDKITPLKDGFLINKLIPNSKIEIIEEALHAPNLSHPEELAQIIKEHLY